jgi:hypothetical protein
MEHVVNKDIKKTHTYIHTYIYTYIHTYIHTYIQSNVVGADTYDGVAEKYCIEAEF